MIALGGGCLYGAGKLGLSVRPEETEAEAQEALFGHRETLYLWYADDTITDYLNSVAVSYNEYQDRVRVVPVYTQGLEYLETINQASLQTQEVPDLYIISNDSLEKAYLAGLACEVTLPEGVLPMTDILPETAVRAVINSITRQAVFSTTEPIWKIGRGRRWKPSGIRRWRRMRRNRRTAATWKKKFRNPRNRRKYPQEMWKKG